MKKVVTFGEIMMRLAPPDSLRFIQTESFDVKYAGAEANVAVALANLEMGADFVTRLPKNDLGEACRNHVRKFGVGVDKIIWGGDRLGIYFVELGEVHRGNKVIYDRSDSAFAKIEPGMFDWEEIFSDACWFHWTGITPAVSQGSAETCMEAAKKAKELDLTVSCDLNYRSKLWKWGGSAKDVMSDLFKYVDIAMGNEEDAEKIFGIEIPGVDVERGKIEAESYRSVAENLMERFQNLRSVAITLRESISASHNKWSAVLYDGEVFIKSPVYDITHIVDRVGGGDSFAAGLIYGYLTYQDDLQKILDFAVAASALKHTIYGDFATFRKEEVERLRRGVTSGRISR